MKKAWIVQTSLMNGTIPVSTINDVFYDEDLAKEVAETLKDLHKNTQQHLSVFIRINECVIYESREDVPILKTNKEED